MAPLTSDIVREQTIRIQVKALDIPPIKDGLLMGKKAAMGAEAMQRMLQLVSHEPFELIEFPSDDVMSHAFFRLAVLKKISREKLSEFALKRLKPLMTENELLLLDIDIGLVIEDKI
jgi:hypothetical protein